MEKKELELLDYGESKSFHDMDVETADGTVFNVHVGAKFVEIPGLRPWFDRRIVFMEVVEEPVVTKYKNDNFFISWKAKNRKTGEVVLYGINVENRHYGPHIYTMTSEKVRSYLKISRERRKEIEKDCKQKGIIRAWQVLKLERRPHDTLVLVNVKTGKQRILVKKGQLLIENKNINFDDIFRGPLIGRDEEKMQVLKEKKFYDIRLAKHNAEGYGILEWTYFKERHFFDCDDFEGQDFYPKVYCLVNADLEIEVPFRQCHNFGCISL